MIRDQLLEKLHPLAQIAGAGEDVSRIGVGAAERRSDEITQAVKIAPVDHIVIARRHPADGKLCPALRTELRGGRCPAEAGGRRTDPSKTVKLIVPDLGFSGITVR